MNGLSNALFEIQPEAGSARGLRIRTDRGLAFVPSRRRTSLGRTDGFLR